MVEYSRTRQERQAHFLNLFQDVTSELVEGNDEDFTTLTGKDEEALAELADRYGLSQDELVFACDALLALREEVQTLTSPLAGRY
jgi:hypothetical protein